MPFIGNKPADSFTSFAKQDFTTSATTSYTLDYPVANANDIALFINFVRQEPTTAYTASGVNLTLTSATSATDDMYCIFLGKAVQTVNPPTGSVGISQLSATGTKDSTTFLRGDNTFASAGGDNTPAFEAYLSGNKTFTDDATSKIPFDAELFDTDGMYDHTTNYRFTPTTAGKYFVYLTGWGTNNSGSFQGLLQFRMILYKNGSLYKLTDFDNRSGTSPTGSVSAQLTLNAVVDMNGSSDYLEAYIYADTTNTPKLYGGSSTTNGTTFGAYKLIGV